MHTIMSINKRKWVATSIIQPITLQCLVISQK